MPAPTEVTEVLVLGLAGGGDACIEDSQKTQRQVAECAASDGAKHGAFDGAVDVVATSTCGVKVE